MLRSMTGYGRSKVTVNGRYIIIEVKSVNHKFFEFSSRISKDYGFLEDKLKGYLQSRISRGKIDLYLHIENLEESDVQVKVNHSLAQGYVKALREIAETYNIDDKLTLDLIAENSDIFSIHRDSDDEDDEVLEAVKIAMKPAIDSFIAMREAEGSKLYADIMSHADKVISLVNEIESKMPGTVSEYRQKLEAKIRELLADRGIDEQRILTETAIYADKVAVDEETVRLRSHFNQLKNFASVNDAVGRKMDFLVQEMNREANTIGSKCSNSEISYIVVEIKSEIEKIREQIQNIE